MQTRLSLQQRNVTPDKDVEKITGLENVHLLLRHLWLTGDAEIWMKNSMNVSC